MPTASITRNVVAEIGVQPLEIVVPRQADLQAVMHGEFATAIRTTDMLGRAETLDQVQAAMHAQATQEFAQTWNHDSKLPVSGVKDDLEIFVGNVADDRVSNVGRISDDP